MKGRFFALTIILAFLAGAAGVFFVASYSVYNTIYAVVGFVVALVLVPTVHEAGHSFFAKKHGLKVVYTKFFCFCFYQKDGKRCFRFASPFGAEETRVLPKDGEDMQRRTLSYVRGGLIFSGIFVLLILLAAVLMTCFGLSCFYLWGGTPYALYLFLLNVFPTQYASGKTDALVYAEIKEGRPTGQALIAAMEMQGRLYAGESYADLPEALYSTDGLREDEQLYALLWEAKYRYKLEKGDLEGAADALNRLVASEEYLTAEERKMVWLETAYMFLLQGDASELKRILEEDESLLRREDCKVKRLLAAYAFACDEKARGEALLKQARICLEKEEIVGVRKHEEILLSRLSA